MKLKRLFMSTLVGALALTSTLSFTPASGIIGNAMGTENVSSEREFDPIVFSGYGSSNAQSLSIADYPFLKGENGEILVITATDNGNAVGNAISLQAMCPRLDNNGETAVTPSQHLKNEGIIGNKLELKVPLADWFASLQHTVSTGVEGSPAGDDVTSLRFQMVGSKSVPSRIQDNTMYIKIEYADDSSTPDSSKPDDSSTPDTQSGTVYYQTKDNNSAIRFIDEVTIEDAQAATTASEETFVARSDAANNYQTNGKNAITKAYKSIIAGGKTVTAGEGKCYLISSAVSNLGNGDKVKAVFTLNKDVAVTNDKEVTISGAADSSKPDESSKPDDSSSKPDDSSSTTDPVITDTLWSGDKTLDNWSGELTINGNLSYWGKGTKITVNYEPVRSSQETVLQLVSRIGKNWTFTDIGYNEIHIPAGQKSYTIELSDDALASLKQDDCYAKTFKADNAVLKSVTITGPYSGPIKPSVSNEWVKNDNGSYSFYWTNASAAPVPPAVSEKYAKIKIPIEGYKNSSITKITLEIQANGTVNGQFGVAQGESTGYKWTSTEYKFTGNATNTYELPVNGVSDGNSIELEIWWINKDTILSIKSITITGERL